MLATRSLDWSDTSAVTRAGGVVPSIAEGKIGAKLKAAVSAYVGNVAGAHTGHEQNGAAAGSRDFQS